MSASSASNTSGPSRHLSMLATGLGCVLLMMIAVWIFSGAIGGGSEPDADTPQAAPAANDPRRFTGDAFVADFTDDAVPPHFSDGSIQRAKDGRRYLGLYREGGVTFTAVDLPPHTFVRATFDLVLIRSWNGSNLQWGPDQWMAKVIGGPMLCRTTFSNCGFFRDNNEQAYPDTYPAPPGVRPHPAWTGATEHQTIGVIQSWGPDSTFDCSSVYRMDWTFPHTGSRIEILFSSMQRLRHDKTFGIMSFRLEPIAGPVPLSPEALAGAWEALASPQPVEANTIVWRLIASPEQAVAMLESRLAGVMDFWPPMPNEALRVSRARHVLEVIGTDSARRLLGSLPVVGEPVIE